MAGILQFVAILWVVAILSVNAAPPQPATAADATKKPTEQSWKPVTDPQEFKVNVADGINGANQIRQEKWDKGTMTGMFSKPVGDGKHEVVKYIADGKGYHVTDVKVVDESELSKIQAGAATTPNQATVDIQKDGADYNYTITPDQIAQQKAAETEKKQS